MQCLTLVGGGVSRCGVGFPRAACLAIDASWQEALLLASSRYFSTLGLRVDVLLWQEQGHRHDFSDRVV